MIPSESESTQLYHRLPQQPFFFGDLHAAFTTPEQYHYPPLLQKPQPNQTLRMSCGMQRHSMMIELWTRELDRIPSGYRSLHSSTTDCLNNHASLGIYIPPLRHRSNIITRHSRQKTTTESDAENVVRRETCDDGMEGFRYTKLFTPLMQT